MSKQLLLFSKYNELNKIYNNNNELFITLPSPNHYYDSKEKKIKNINDDDNIIYEPYSILGLNNNNNNATLIKLESGIVAVKIPYMKLFELYKIDD